MKKVKGGYLSFGAIGADKAVFLILQAFTAAPRVKILERFAPNLEQLSEKRLCSPFRFRTEKSAQGVGQDDPGWNPPKNAKGGQLLPKFGAVAPNFPGLEQLQTRVVLRLDGSLLQLLHFVEIPPLDFV